MLTVPTDQFPNAKRPGYRENTGARFVRRTISLLASSAVFFPLWRGWVAYVSQFEYLRQETGVTKLAWSESRYRGWSEAMVKLVGPQWYRGILPYLSMVPIVSFSSVMRTNMKKSFPYDGTWPNYFVRAGACAAVATFCEIVCFPLRLAFIYMASEPHTALLPRPSANQVITEIFKYGPKNPTLRLAFVPGWLASVYATMPDTEESSSVSLTFASYLLNLISIRMIIASLPGAPRPYTSFAEAFKTHFALSPVRTWMVGILSFWIPLISICSMRPRIDNLYFQAIGED